MLMKVDLGGGSHPASPSIFVSVSALASKFHFLFFFYLLTYLFIFNLVSSTQGKHSASVLFDINALFCLNCFKIWAEPLYMYTSLCIYTLFTPGTSNSH